MPGSGPNGEWVATTDDWWRRVRYPIVAFKIWYSDGSSFAGPCSSWPSAPAVGVAVLAVFHPAGSPTERVVVCGKDEYTLPGQLGSKLGQMMSLDAYERIRLAAHADAWRP